ncbi:MAG TPA: hypothetical protein VFE14_15740 [Micromonosporaceae bacterium]|nr:hypothetical protein [Micromonosporaceae bacterium]
MPKIPRIAYGAALIAAGALVPSALPAPHPAPAGSVGMKHEAFRQESVTIPRGGSVTFVNDSGFVHVIGPGYDGRLKSAQGVPNLGDLGAFMSETDDVFVSGPWNTPGEYRITCSLHPEMNLTVIVTG